MAQPGQQTINIGDLDIAQLGDVKKQLEEELSHLTNSFAQLKQAQNKFKQCIENVKELGQKENKDKALLVPLTNSLYLPGKLVNPEHVIIDVGTGYYVKKSQAQAVKYYSQKATYIQSNLEKLEETISRKRENVSVVVQILQQKVSSQINAGGPVPGAGPARPGQPKVKG
ncbi:Prefoldin alpha subunit [Ephemerocybe angulata]|uniref:Prefoldin alpha subunit n=1 Tax=Ephemerocybe angulata TaxID=980116 RepID=A0A8H6HI88_9AGAR|nr:Prefoldin alpha subunit [Tulosesus angulatus]